MGKEISEIEDVVNNLPCFQINIYPFLCRLD